MKRKSLNIEEFFEGEEIERVEPARWPIEYAFNLKGKKVVTKWGKDNTFYDPCKRSVIFKGISEGKIYVLDKGLRGEKDLLWELDYYMWKDGWAKYVDPLKVELIDEKNSINHRDAKKFYEIIKREYSN